MLEEASQTRIVDLFTFNVTVNGIDFKVAIWDTSSPQIFPRNTFLINRNFSGTERCYNTPHFSLY